MTFIYLIYEEYKNTEYGYIFEKIANSEWKHMNAVEKIASKYNLELPNLDFGEFSIEEFQALYNELLDRGLISFEEALSVGKDIETMDIEDITKEESIFSDNDYILFVLYKLSNASSRHYEAFDYVSSLVNTEEISIQVEDTNNETENLIL